MIVRAAPPPNLFFFCSARERHRLTATRPALRRAAVAAVAAMPPPVAAKVAAPSSPTADPHPIALVRRKSFPMPPISVADAIVCLDYIDHEFYVFRNAATDEVNVVYKRNSGGVGLIEPERD